jgi:hypothetical protein
MGVRLRWARTECFLIIKKAEDLTVLRTARDWRRLFHPSPRFGSTVADRFGLRPKLRFNVAMSSAE